MKLKDRRIVITGVSRGVGLSTARLFLREGADILGIARDRSRLASVNAEFERLAPGRFHALVIDLNETQALDRVARAVEARWGALDVLINNAGVQFNQGEPHGFAEEDPSAIERSLRINLLAPHRLIVGLLPLLRRGAEPRIINLTSGAGTLDGVRQTGLPSYRLSKWALNGLTIQYSAQLHGTVAVNALDPGWVKTDMGGPRAPGSPEESAQAALSLATAPFSETGKIWKDGHEIAF
jgi:NAD(P)-dependent dehydrogenase (short-subunit alcohol dehydrogenase family)